MIHRIALTSLGLGLLVPATIAQANPIPTFQKSDPLFPQWEVVREKFGCMPMPQTVNRFELAAAVNACHDRVNQLVEAAKLQSQAFASDDELKLWEPLLKELNPEIAMLTKRGMALKSDVLLYQQFSTSTKSGVQSIFLCQ